MEYLSHFGAANSHRQRPAGCIISLNKDYNQQLSDRSISTQTIKLDKVKQQIRNLENENKLSRYKKSQWQPNTNLQQEKQQLEEEIKNISNKLQELKQSKIHNREQITSRDWLQDKEDFEQKWNDLSNDDEIQSFQDRMQTLLNEEQEPPNRDQEIETLTKEVEDLLCFKEEPMEQVEQSKALELYVIEEEQSVDQSFV